MWKLKIFQILVYLFAILLHQTCAGRIERLEKKIHGMEMSVIQDVHMLREDLAGTNEKLENIIELMNDTTKQHGPNENVSTSVKEADEILAKRIETRVEGIVMKEVRRIKRAFVTQKMHVTELQNEENSKLNTQAMQQKSTLDKMTEKVNSKVNNASQMMTETLEQFNQTLGAQLDSMRDSIQTSLRLVERGVNKSLLEIAERSEDQYKAMDGGFERKMDDLFRVVQNFSNDKILREIVQGVQALEASYLTTMFLQTVNLKRDIIGVVETRLSDLIKSNGMCSFLSASSENCDVSTFSGTANLMGSAHVRLGNLSITNQGVQGRLEIFYNNIWGTVCDDDFDSFDAKVACRMLGYQYGEFKINAYFGQGSDPILFDNMACNGEEDNLFDCDRNTETHNCQHIEDVGVICRN